MKQTPKPVDNWRERLAAIVGEAAHAAMDEAKPAGMAGDCREMQLYFRDSVKHPGQGALLLTRAEEVPDDFEPTGYRLPCTVPYTDYYKWIANHCGQLAIL